MDEGVERARIHFLKEIIEYKPGSVESLTITKKTTGYINAMAFDAGQEFDGKTSPFDSFVQVTEGDAEIIIGENQNFLKTSEAIIIPAHIPNMIKANKKFKMLLTVIKSGYE